MNTTIADTTAQDIQKIIALQKAFFRSGKSQDVSYRRQQLKRLKVVIQENESEIFDALYADFKKPKFEALGTEVALVIGEIDHMLSKVRDWAEPKSVKANLLNFPSDDHIRAEPYGLNLIIAPWNFPFQLAIHPLIAAIAAGNCVVLKPSELAPHTAAVIEKVINASFEPGHVSTVQGGVPTSTALLAEAWDHIFFTGSTAVGKIVMRAAAEHLTPVTLELGGKCPCIVDQTADIKVAAKRIAWGKFMNSGQACIAPDYLLVHKSVKDELVAEIGREIRGFYGADPEQSPDFARIINSRHFERLEAFLKDGDVLVGGQTNADDCYIAPTLLGNVAWDAGVMQEEIFGPILPVMSFESLDQAIQIVLDRPKPLALYIFSGKRANQKRVERETSSGGICINDTIIHFTNSNLPFGGVGPSGMGSYHGKFGFDTFSHFKAVSRRGNWVDVPLRYPPYKGKMDWVRRAFKWS